MKRHPRASGCCPGCQGPFCDVKDGVTLSAGPTCSAACPAGVARVEPSTDPSYLVAQAGPPPGRGPGRGAGPPPGRGPAGGAGRARGLGPGPGGGGPAPDAQFAADRDVFHFLLENHVKVKRHVQRLPDGVETLTESDDPQIADTIRKHVQAMYARVEQKRPIHLRDPLFGAVFRHADQIEMKMELTEKGIRVRETSRDAYVARLIQAHAAVVDGFVKNGFTEAQKNHAVPAPDDTDSPPADSSALEIRRAFASFDKAYIPALALTNQGKQRPSEMAMMRLREAWRTLAQQLQDVLQEDTEWPQDQEAMRDAIGAAARELSAERPASAHEILEEMRGRLSELRRRNRWTYDLDALNEFHETMEKIVKPATKMTAADVNEAAQRDLRKLLKQAQQQWSAVEQAQFDSAARALDEATQNSLSQLVQQQRQALSRLEAALEATDADQILQAARGIKPPFAQLYMSFGDFPQPSP